MPSDNTHSGQPTPIDANGHARIGVGIDTSRYGHYSAFLRPDCQPAADELLFPESADGYLRLHQRFQLIASQHARVLFVIRLDAAGQYADNLLHFLHNLHIPCKLVADKILNADFIISCGDPQRNKNYRLTFFGSKKSDPIEARAAARFAATERPQSTPLPSAELRVLRHITSRLQSVVRQRTRLINQLHQLLALAFPELALVVKDISAGWVLELVTRYPTAGLLAAAGTNGLDSIPYLPGKHIEPLLRHARSSVGSLDGANTQELVRDQVRQLREVNSRQQRLETMLVTAYRALPQPNHIDTIRGIGEVSAAVFTAFILDIARFATPGELVGYFGAFPVEESSGVDRNGQPRPPRKNVMSRRGNDLVRRYLWMAALSAVQDNPAVRPLYQRVIAKHPKQKAIAIGHAMRKLLHLVFAIWKSGKPFNPTHDKWEKARHLSGNGDASSDQSQATQQRQEKSQTEGHKPTVEPAVKVVTPIWEDSVAKQKSVGDGSYIEFAHLKSQLSMARVLDHLGLSSKLRGSGGQCRCACPIHSGDGRGRTFNVNLQQNVFCCFDPKCGKQGDVIDLWAALRGVDLREAAIDLVRTFNLEPAPNPRTEKRNG